MHHARRPPTAFTRKRELSASEPGHVVLLEYLEQQVRFGFGEFIEWTHFDRTSYRKLIYLFD